MSAKRKVTLLYRSVSLRGDVTVTSDRHHAERVGKIERIYRSKRQAAPVMALCSIPKDTAPWEIASELEQTHNMNGAPLVFQLTELGKMGDVILNSLADGGWWDKHFMLVPQSLVPVRERAAESADDDEDDE